MIRIAAFIFGLFAMGVATGFGCSPQMQADAADKAYLADHLRCVEQYPTRTEIDACRAEVRWRWGIRETVTTKRDGGRDADAH